MTTGDEPVETDDARSRVESHLRLLVGGTEKETLAHG